jgi:hypothetical protein
MAWATNPWNDQVSTLEQRFAALFHAPIGWFDRFVAGCMWFFVVAGGASTVSVASSGRGDSGWCGLGERREIL